MANDGEEEIISIRRRDFDDLVATVALLKQEIENLKLRIEILEAGKEAIKNIDGNTQEKSTNKNQTQQTQDQNSNVQKPVEPKPKTVCLFTGIRVGPEAAVQLAEFREKVKVNKQFNHFTHEKDFHVTIQFYGSVQESVIPDFEEAIRSVTEKHRCFELKTTIPQTFGGKKKPGVLWIVPGGDTDSLQSLGKDMQQAFIKYGFQPDNVYTPHITICKRYKSKKEFIAPDESIYPKETNFSVTRVDLLLSDPSTNPRYHTVASFPLLPKLENDQSNEKQNEEKINETSNDEKQDKETNIDKKQEKQTKIDEKQEKQTKIDEKQEKETNIDEKQEKESNIDEKQDKETNIDEKQEKQTKIDEKQVNEIQIIEEEKENKINIDEQRENEEKFDDEVKVEEKQTNLAVIDITQKDEIADDNQKKEDSEEYIEKTNQAEKEQILVSPELIIISSEATTKEILHPEQIESAPEINVKDNEIKYQNNLGKEKLSEQSKIFPELLVELQEFCDELSKDPKEQIHDTKQVQEEGYHITPELIKQFQDTSMEYTANSKDSKHDKKETAKNEIASKEHKRRTNHNDKFAVWRPPKSDQKD